MAKDPQPIEPYQPPIERDPVLRRRAIRRIAARKAFYVHASVYAAVMSFLTLIWVVTGGDYYFWPIWPMLGWGLGLALHGLSLTWETQPSEREIAVEAEKIRRRSTSDGPQDRAE